MDIRVYNCLCVCLNHFGLLTRISNKRAGWNKRAGRKIPPNFREFWRPKCVENTSKQYLKMESDNNNQNNHSSIKRQ